MSIQNKTPDSNTQIGPFSISQRKNVVILQNQMNHAEVENLKKIMVLGLPNLKRSIDLEIQELTEICKNVCPQDLLTASYFSNCACDPESYSEMQFKGNEAFSEYLLSIVVALPLPHSDQHVEAEHVEKVLKLCESIHNKLHWYTSVQNTNSASKSVLKELSSDVKLFDMMVRGSSYKKHYLELVQYLFSPHDKYFESHFGATASACIGGILEIVRQIDCSVGDYLRACHNLQVLLKKLHKLEGSKATLDKKELEDYQNTKKLIEAIGVPGHASLLKVIENAELPVALLRRLSCAYGDNADYFNGEKSGWPDRVSLVTKRPIVNDNENYYVFVPGLIYRNMIQIFEGWIKDEDEGFYGKKYQKTRSNCLVDMALGCFSTIMPQCKSYRELFYFVEINGKKERCELDGLVWCDDFVILIEAKAGLFSHSAKRGGDKRLQRHLEDLYDDAYKQGMRARKCIEENDRVLFQQENGQPLLTMSKDKIRQLYVVIATLESQEQISTQLGTLRKQSFLQGGQWPWIVFINDLRVVADILAGEPSIFFLYLERRIQSNNKPQFSAADELDIFMRFLEQGLFLDDMPDDPNFEFNLLGYTEKLDRYFDYKAGIVTTGDKPRYSISDPMRQLIQKIESCGSDGAIGVCTRLLMYDYTLQDSIVCQIARISNACLKDSKDHDFTIQKRGKHGVTFLASKRPPGYVLQQLRNFFHIRQYEIRAALWDLVLITVSEASDYRFTLCVLDDLPSESIVLDKAVTLMQNNRFERALSTGYKPSRNDECPCGSGKKYKKCHGG